MSAMVVVVISGLLAVVAVIGVADGLTHLLCRVARSLREPEAVRVNVERPRRSSQF
ncbi:MAG: hypothetical protein J7521_09955 [Caulobacter sp.]|nr:hypothetical protein [Caulobacter sp.]